MKMKLEHRDKKRVLSITLLFLLGLLLSVWVLGKGALDPTIKIGFSGRETLHEWSASYRLLTSKAQRSIGSKNQPHHIEIEVESLSGALALTITNQDGTVAYAGSEIPTSSFSVEAEGKTTIKLDAASHRGGYSIQWE